MAKANKFVVAIVFETNKPVLKRQVRGLIEGMLGTIEAAEIEDGLTGEKFHVNRASVRSMEID